MKFNFIKDEWWPVFVPVNEKSFYKNFHTAELDEGLVREYLSLFQKFCEVKNKLHDEILKKG